LNNREPLTSGHICRHRHDGQEGRARTDRRGKFWSTCTTVLVEDRAQVRIAQRGKNLACPLLICGNNNHPSEVLCSVSCPYVKAAQRGRNYVQQGLRHKRPIVHWSSLALNPSPTYGILLQGMADAPSPFHCVFMSLEPHLYDLGCRIVWCESRFTDRGRYFAERKWGLATPDRSRRLPL
jgi:hypothetical protein